MENSEEIQQESQLILTQVQSVKIVDQLTYIACANNLKGIKRIKAKIKEIFNPIVKKAHEAHKEAKSRQNQLLEPVEEAEKIVKNACKKYEIKMEELKRKKQEEEAEKERERLKKEAEDKKWEENDKAVEEIEEKIKEVAPSQQAVQTIDKVVGLGIKRTWKFRIIDATLVPREYLSINEVEIGKTVRSNKELTSIPGIQAYLD